MIAATDFFTVEVWNIRGLTTYYILFVIKLATRSVTIAGITTSPNNRFMQQIARQLTDDFDGFPMFSRDGKKLVFASNRNAKEEGETNIFIADWIN